MSLFHHLVKAVSHEAVIENTKKIGDLCRESNFSGYQDAADYVLQRLEDYKLQAEKIELSADGKSTYGDAVIPHAWNCSAGKLEMTQSESKTLMDRTTSPHLVGMWSPSTPEGGLEADLVCLEKGDENELGKKDVKGKIVLTPGRAMDIREAAQRHGVAAIVSYWSPNPQGKNEFQWLGSNTHAEGGWGPRINEEPMIQMSLSPDHGRELAMIASEQNVRLRITIQSETYSDNLDIVSGLIPGQSDKEEVLLLAPLYGPGANFHAVSAAVLLEIARLIQKQIGDKVFPQPQRSIRFLFLPRIYGSIAWAQLQPEILKKSIFALLVDAGAGNPDISWCRWSYRTGPGFQRHYADGLAWQILNQYLQEWRPQRFLESRSFSLNADVLFNDPAIGVPTHWLYGGTETECRYNSLDTPDTIDARSCVDLAAAGAAAIFSLASVSKDDIPDLAYWNYMLAQERLNDEVLVLLNQAKEAKSLNDLNETLSLASRFIPRRIQMENQALLSLKSLHERAESLLEWRNVEELQSTLQDLGKAALILIRTQLTLRCDQLSIMPTKMEVSPLPPRDERIPKRTNKAIGTITLDTLPYNEWTSPVKSSPRVNLPFILAWWLTDGHRTIGEIERVLEMELRVYRECIPAWFTFLEKHGYVEFSKLDS